MIQKRGGLKVIAILGVALAAPTSNAREMQGRFGLGYNAEFGSSIPGVSVKYGLSRDLAIAGVVGMMPIASSTSTSSSPSSVTTSVTALKGFKNIFYETNLNFYFTVAAGLLSNAYSQSGITLLAGFGAEFFIPGVDSLGLSIETGAAYDNVSGSYALKTLGVSFLNAGIHFYF